MRPLPGLTWAMALATVLAGSYPVHAAWNNVFQVCCNTCGTPAPVVASYADPCPPACPPPTTTCTTRYVQRTYYQPVVTMRYSTYYEPVTTYRTSYYYEPVTTYRYSCYFDPCTCSYQRVAIPTTSYQLRSQCCPVTSYLQRTCMTPVTTYQQSFYYEPVTTCCTTSANGAEAAAPSTSVVTPPAGTVPAAPSTTQDTLPPAPPSSTPSATTEPPTSRQALRPNPIQPISPPPMPPAQGGSLRSTPAPAPAVRLDRIASRNGGNVQATVVDSARVPVPGARVLLVSADSRTDQFTVTANAQGNFQSNLQPGGWLLYTYDAAGKPVFSRRIEVPSERSLTITLTRR